MCARPHTVHYLCSQHPAFEKPDNRAEMLFMFLASLMLLLCNFGAGCRHGFLLSEAVSILRAISKAAAYGACNYFFHAAYFLHSVFAKLPHLFK